MPCGVVLLLATAAEDAVLPIWTALDRAGILPFGVWSRLALPVGLLLLSVYRQSHDHLAQRAQRRQCGHPSWGLTMHRA